MTLLNAQGLTHQYGRRSLLGAAPATTVLHDVSLSIAPGERLALVGRSGSGKSTLARVLMGLETPTDGKVMFERRPLAQFTPADWRWFRRSVQMVFQDSTGAVDPRHTLEQIISAPLRYLTDMDAGARRAHTLALLASVGLQAGDVDKRPAQLSGGQLQRACIARALAPSPRVLILDEALSNLDIPLQIHILDLLDNLQRERNIACLFITHDLRLVQRFCQRLLIIDDGRIVEAGAVTSMHTLAHPFSRSLLQAILPVMPRVRHPANGRATRTC